MKAGAATYRFIQSIFLILPKKKHKFRAKLSIAFYNYDLINDCYNNVGMLCWLDKKIHCQINIVL